MPKMFSDIYGQKNAVSILSAQLKSGNISHGYVVLGNEGTGKNYLAMEFARYILGADGEAEENTAEGVISHPDFIYIDGTEGIKIETVREGIERVNLSPNLSKYKVMMLAHAENIGLEAANALLKTLEEPPSDSVIILTAISEKSLPETIISRVQKIKLNAIAREDIEKILAKQFSKEEMEKVIDYAEGSVGEAKKLLSDPEYAEKKKTLFRDVEALVMGQSVIEKFKIIEKYEKAKETKKFFDVFAGVVFEGLRREGEEKLAPEKLLGISAKILKIYADLDYNVSLRLALESLILEYLVND